MREERTSACVRTSHDDERSDVKEARGVSSHKYRELKRKHLLALEVRLPSRVVGARPC